MSSQPKSLELRLTPHGVVAARPYEGNDRWARGVASRFSEHEAAGLVALAAATLPHHVDASVLFWRDMAAEFLQALCHVPETAPFTQDTIELPSPARLAEWV